jgi:hypothetical protein
MRRCRRQLSLCADIVSNWSEFDTIHGDFASVQILVANDCAGFATRVIGASLRDEVLPEAISPLKCRTPADGSTRALRKRTPFDWDAAFRKMAAEGHQGAIDVVGRWDQKQLDVTRRSPFDAGVR